MKVLKIKQAGFRQYAEQLTSLLRSGFLQLSDSPQVALRFDPTKPPKIEFKGSKVIIRFADANLEKFGKDLDLKWIEIDGPMIRIYTDWILGIDADIEVELV